MKFLTITPGQRHKYEPSFETIFNGVRKAATDIKLADFQQMFGKMNSEEQLQYIKENSFLKSIYDIGFQDGWDYAKEVKY